MTRLKDKERILKATREKQVVTYKEAPIRLSSDFSTETFQARWDWCEIFKVMKSNDHNKALYPARLSFKIEGEALGGVALWIGGRPENQSIAGLMLQPRHMPGLQAISPVWGVLEATTH